MEPMERDMDGGRPRVRVGTAAAHDLPGLLKLLPPPAEPEAALALALAANHLAQGRLFTVIADPAGFRDRYRRRRAAEPPDPIPRPLGAQLALFDMPDLDQIAAPAPDGRTLVFFAENRALGLPYRATLNLDAPEQGLTCLPLPPAAKGSTGGA